MSGGQRLDRGDLTAGDAQQEEAFDLIIVGAGMVGGTLALALSGHGLRIGLLDAGSLQVGAFDRQSPFEPRVSALSPASRKLFQRLGVWPGILARRACGYHSMRVWDGLGSGEIGFEAASLGLEHLGHIVENRVVRDAVLERLNESDPRLLANGRLVGLQREKEAWRLTLEDGRNYSAALLVAADGAASAVARLTAGQTREWDYLHQAIVTTVRCSEPHRNTAWQRFTEDGPLAFLPLDEAGGHACSIVWSALPERAKALVALPEAEFCRALGAAFEERLGAILSADRRLLIPLRQRHARRYVSDGLAFIGDAAHVIHPLAGQGVNLGLLDVAVLSDVLLRALERGEPLAAQRTLSRFERRRMPHNLAMMAAMEGLQRLFQADALPLRWLRNSGLRWVDRRFQAKSLFMGPALGLGELPSRWKALTP